MQACQEGVYDVLFVDGIDLAHVLRKVNVMEALQKVGTIVAFANEPNETVTVDAIGNGYVLPTGTTLETWGDGEATKGVFTLAAAGHETTVVDQVFRGNPVGAG